MSSVGVMRRLSQLMPSEEGRCVLVHAAADWCSVTGENQGANSMASDIARCGVDGIIFSINDGIRPLDVFLGKKAPAILMHVKSENLPHQDSSNPVGLNFAGGDFDQAVMQAFRFGALVLVTDFTVGHDTDEGEANNFHAVSRMVSKSEELGLPCLVTAIPTGNRITKETYADCVGLASRMASEAGAQCLAIPYPGNKDSTTRILEATGVPTFLLQLPKEFSRSQPECDVAELVDIALGTGACGVILSSPKAKSQIDDIRWAVKTIHGAEPE